MEITRFTTPLGYVGVGLSLVGLVLPLVSSGPWSSVCLGIGTLCLAGFLMGKTIGLMKSGHHRSTKLGLHSLGALLLAGIILGLANYLAAQHAPEFDFSETKNFTLSRQTYQVLRQLPREVSITVFSHEGSPGYGPYQDLLTTYDKESPAVTVTFIDPERQPDKAKAYRVAKIDTAVIESGEQTIYVQRASESDITNALIRVTRDQKKRIVFITGHGEKSVTDTESPGLSRAADALAKQGYALDTLPWQSSLSPPPPAVIIPSTNQPLTETDRDWIAEYIEKGGRLLILTDPSNGQTMDALVNGWGLHLGTGILADPKDRLGRGSPTALMVRTFTTHDITEDFTSPIIFPVSRPVSFEPPDNHPWQFIALAQTSPESWEERDLSIPQPTFTEGVDPKGSFTVAGALIPKEPSQKPDSDPAIIVVGNSAFATNGWFTYPGNTDFFLKTVAWLAREDALISLTPKEPAFHPFVPNPSQEQALVFFQVLFLPLLTLSLGLSVWKRRRNL